MRLFVCNNQFQLEPDPDQTTTTTMEQKCIILLGRHKSYKIFLLANFLFPPIVMLTMKGPGSAANVEETICGWAFLFVIYLPAWTIITLTSSYFLLQLVGGIEERTFLEFRVGVPYWM